MVVPRFVRQALLGQPIPVFGDGTQRRSFTWVGDVVGAMITLIERPDAYGEVFNIGHTKDISIYELAVLIRQLTGSRSDIVRVPYHEAYESGFEDMARRLPDISKLKQRIGYAPTMELTEMLNRIIEAERERLVAEGLMLMEAPK
jgi:UDP-glucose 4-epimerase